MAVLVPLYLPFVVDDVDASAGAPILLGGINMYLQQKSGLFRRTPRWVDRWLDSPNEITADATDAADGSDPSRPSVTAGEDTRSPEAPTAASDPAARNRSVPPALILVDEHGGSCATAARLVAGDYPDVRILCGVNLAMLLGFVSWRENLELPDLVRRLINTGRDAIVEAVIDR